MDRTLRLTSPPMTGEDVKRAQYVMNNNVFEARYYQGDLDGVYGEVSAQGAYRAHYWLGFTLEDLNTLGKRYGEVLDNLLTGKTPLDKARTTLRNRRLNATPTTPMRVKAFRHFETHLGVKESPAGSNKCYASAWYGLVGPWCAMAVTEAYVVGGGSKAFVKGSRYAYVPFLEGDARAGRNNLTITLDPQQGDPVCFDWDNDGISDHVGLFDKWLVRSNGTFQTIEGNTSVSSNSNGGEVMRRERSLSEVSFRVGQKPAFIHVGA
jgi:hypothetical protein